MKVINTITGWISSITVYNSRITNWISRITSAYIYIYAVRSALGPSTILKRFDVLYMIVFRFITEAYVSNEGFVVMFVVSAPLPVPPLPSPYPLPALSRSACSHPDETRGRLVGFHLSSSEYLIGRRQTGPKSSTVRPPDHEMLISLIVAGAREVRAGEGVE